MRQAEFEKQARSLAPNIVFIKYVYYYPSKKKRLLSEVYIHINNIDRDCFCCMMMDEQKIYQKLLAQLSEWRSKSEPRPTTR